jgi:hypothetical protein
MFRHIYVIKTSDRTEEKQSVYEFDSEEKALTDMYNLHGVALKNSNLQATFSLVINEIGEEVERLAASIPDPNNKRQRYEIKPRIYWRAIKASTEEFKIYEYETKQLARGNFYTRYAALRNDETCTEATIACINGEGINLELKVWERSTGEKNNSNEPQIKE